NAFFIQKFVVFKIKIGNGLCRNVTTNTNKFTSHFKRVFILFKILKIVKYFNLLYACIIVFLLLSTLIRRKRNAQLFSWAFFDIVTNLLSLHISFNRSTRT